VVEFRVLGSLEVRHGDAAVQLGGPRIRALLAVLLTRHGEPVQADVLIQALWGDEAPPAALRALRVSVSRLRQALGPAAERLQTVGSGYRLHVEPGELDAERFEDLYARAGGLPPAEAARKLRGALGLWRGPALADVRYEPWAQAEIRRLDELKAIALEARIDAEMALGDHARLVAELEALVEEYPLRERLRAQLMIALYRSGRQPDALAAFHAARDVLDEELGLEPGPELRALEQRILMHDPSLAAPEQVEPPPAPPTPTFGRDEDMRAVLHALGETRLVTLTGTGGVGKTRLAVEVARRAGGRFVSLAPISSADRVPSVICDALGVARVPGESDGEALDRALARGPLLLVLDNLEHLPDAAPLIAGLLEGHPALAILATSRHPLRVRAERLYPVTPLTAAGAVELFTDRARARDPMFIADDAVAEICERVGRLPLAIELAAARLGVLTPSHLAERLGNELGVLERGPRDAPQRQQTLRATLDWSYGLLDDGERRAFAALGAFVGGCDLEAAEAVTGSPLTALEGLVDKSLATAAAGRLTLLEPVRQYAVERLAKRPDADVVRLRHLQHYLSVAQQCEEPIWVRHRSCPEFDTLQREHENLRAAITWGLASGRALQVVELLSAIASYMWYSHDRTGQLRRWRDRALAAAGDDLPLGVRAHAEFALGFNSSDRGERSRHDLAALTLFREVGDDAMIARCLVDLAMTARFDANPTGAVAYAEEAVQRARSVADNGLIGAALAELSASTHGIEAAAPLARAAVTHLRAADAHELAAQVISELCVIAALEDAHNTVEQLGREAVEAAAAVGDTWTIAYVQGNVATAALLGDRYDAARTGFQDELMTAVAHALPGFSRFDPLYGLAALAGLAGDDRRAAVLAGAASAADAFAVSPAARPVYNRLEQRFLAPARDRLGDEAWEAALDEGRRMQTDALVEYALEPTPSPDRIGR
jgi:predicted ATPase/DNA-binding winged helix-turn-helix (wHTH) protein